jgi:hypothetical protein
MAKHQAPEIVFCDQCGVSIPPNLTPFVVPGPDGNPRRLCQECKWAATAEEDQPTLAIDDTPIDGVDEQPAPAPVPAALVEEEEPEPGAPVAGGMSFRNCRTFICKAAPQAMAFMDNHIAEFTRANKLRLKFATMCHGIGAVGSQGTKEDAVFVTIWW